MGPVIDYSLLALLTGWTYWFARRRLAPGMRAAAEADKAPADGSAA